MRRFLFLLRTYPDVDHIAPMIWTCLERGDAAIALFEGAYPYRQDFRIDYLRTYQRFRVIDLFGVASASRRARLASRLLWNRFTLKRMLVREAIDACFFEWGPGIAGGRGHFVNEIRGALQPGALRLELIRAAKQAGLPIFALPHGITTKLNVDYHPKMIAALERNSGELPFEDRNCFSAWVFTAEFQRKLMVEYGRMDPSVGQTWGSLRFCPQWMEVLRRICPDEMLPAKKDTQLRVVCFLPKWGNRVDKAGTIELLEGIARREDVQLIIKTHPRPGTAELDVDDLARLREHVVLRDEANSHALIRASDVVIDIGSSIAVDVLLQAKHLVYPAYLHENRLVFDEYGGCARARSSSEVHQILDGIASGTQSLAPPGEIAAAISQLVYGGAEPFDVPARYYREVRQRLHEPLAGGQRRVTPHRGD